MQEFKETIVNEAVNVKRDLQNAESFSDRYSILYHFMNEYIPEMLSQYKRSTGDSDLNGIIDFMRNFNHVGNPTVRELYDIRNSATDAENYQFAEPLIPDEWNLPRN